MLERGVGDGVGLGVGVGVADEEPPPQAANETPQAAAKDKLINFL